MTFEAFIDTAWNDHAERTEAVAERLAQSLALVTAADRVAPYARLVTHVYGEHLGEWSRGVALLESLRRLPACDGSDEAARIIARNVAALRYAAGDPAPLAALATDERIAALALAASAFAGRSAFAAAIATYAEALRCAEPGLPDGSPALRALAAGGNNLAAALEEKRDRSPDETRGMLVAAEAGLRYWTRAGTWLEEERAWYRLARSQLQAGDADSAIASAGRCIDVCARNAAPAFERFFGYAVLAVAHRAAGSPGAFAAARDEALAQYGQVPEDERQWCAADLAEITA
jgi:hypothetical protein